MGLLIPHNITVCGHRTSIRLELDMWHALHEVCCRENKTIHEVCSAVAQSLPGQGSMEKAGATPSLTSAVRVFLLRYFRDAATHGGHGAVRHGTTVHPPLDDWSFAGLPSVEKQRRGRRPGSPADQPSVAGGNGSS